jgi:hypothetical protein
MHKQRSGSVRTAESGQQYHQNVKESMTNVSDMSDMAESCNGMTDVSDMSDMTDVAEAINVRKEAHEQGGEGRQISQPPEHCDAERPTARGLLVQKHRSCNIGIHGRAGKTPRADLTSIGQLKQRIGFGGNGAKRSTVPSGQQYHQAVKENMTDVSDMTDMADVAESCNGMTDVSDVSDMTVVAVRKEAHEQGGEGRHFSQPPEHWYTLTWHEARSRARLQYGKPASI